MRQRLIPLIICVLLMSCAEEMDISKLNSKYYVTMYVFASSNDTIPIEISAARPLNANSSQLTLDAVSCNTNGHADSVVFVGRDTVNGIIREKYNAVGKRRTGDRIDVIVTGRDIPQVFASTVIPPSANIETCKMDTVFYKGNQYVRFNLELSDSEFCHHYAVRIAGRYTSDDGSYVVKYQDIETSSEPLLNNYSETDMDFGSYNDYYHRMYIFNDETAADGKIRLHLYVLQQFWMEDYRIELFSLSPEYYFMLKSLNDIRNNTLGEYGLSFVSKTYTNVVNGIGCVGAFGKDETMWLPINE